MENKSEKRHLRADQGILETAEYLIEIYKQ
jgi:hypothetical protein